MTMLISFHLPKAAGISFYNSLHDHYGDKIQKDYLDYPMNTPPLKRKYSAFTHSLKNRFTDFKDAECIHGHFLPLKYKNIKHKNEVQYMTWMRDPAERIASQYFYMLRNYKAEIGKTQPLYKRIIEEEWSLERYCFSQEFKNTCAQMLWGFPLRKFDFIGIVEDYENDLVVFSKQFLKTPLKNYQSNTNPSLENKSYFEDNELKSKVLEFHAQDYQLYQYALKLKKSRESDTPLLYDSIT